jgi:DNA (cytosine-5)-methyltransferase 1
VKKNRKHIELFAGCGGMAVGMESSGFRLEFANEVSPMASNTFAHNLLNSNLEELGEHVKWIHSRHNLKNYSSRLRENLLTHEGDEFCDLDFEKDLKDLSGKLLVGDVRHLKRKLIENKISDPYNGDLDLISGGPPCQSFSLAGKRELNNYKNSLPLDYAEICEVLRPKVVLLENVKGILSAFNVEGEKHYAWVEVAKAFATRGYAPICMLINSKYFGIAQNRPRYIMLALRKDVFQKLIIAYPRNKILKGTSAFVSKANKDIYSVGKKDIHCYDIEKETELFDGVILPKVTTFNSKDWVTVKDAIGDLSKQIGLAKSNYVNELNEVLNFQEKEEKYRIANHNERNHTPKIQNRFLFYQLLNYSNGFKESFLKLKKSGIQPDKSDVKELYRLLNDKVIEFKKLFRNLGSFEEFVFSVEPTKKHSQRALNELLPSPAQLTIPDDICHYSPFENRALTVREMARIQSFPDWFTFKSKETTGGKNRSYEVPQYTQVGNAVPPKLAFHLGSHIYQLLGKIEQEDGV